VSALGLIVVFLAGCSYFVSWDEVSQKYINRPVLEFETWQNPDEVRTLPNGRREYKYHLKKLDPSCIHYWIVNPEGIIVDYRYEGRCRPIG
jgi:hypothetical protein